jgi:LPXTG-site transpeptidase (sortase) family protein
MTRPLRIWFAASLAVSVALAATAVWSRTQPQEAEVPPLGVRGSLLLSPSSDAGLVGVSEDVTNATLTALAERADAPRSADGATLPLALPSASADGATLPSAPLPAGARTIRLEIPAIGVDATVLAMGVDTSGVMEVPGEADVVAWYDFSASPGNEGNAVMSGHVDYRGRLGVFYDLRKLSEGDEVLVWVDGQRLRYVVEQSYLVRPEQADLQAIVGARTGAETITLITCGGTFDRAAREYDHRQVVRARRTTG